MSQDDCAVIDAGRVEVVDPPAGQGGLVLLCARLSVYWRYDDFEGYPIPGGLVLDESCDTRSSIVCVGSESRSSFLDHFNFVYEFLLVWVPNSI